MGMITKGLRAVLAGVYVSIGCIAYVRASNVIFGMLMFSACMAAIAMFNLPLFTGRVYRVVIVPSNRVFRTVFELAIMWFCNFLGCYVVSKCLILVRYVSIVEKRCIEISIHRIADGPLGLFILGLGCNMVLYLAFRASRDRDDLVGTLMIMLASMVYIDCGFEHSIADAFFMMMGHLTFPDRFQVLLPVALGNGVGAVIPALILDRQYERIG